MYYDTYFAMRNQALAQTLIEHLHRRKFGAHYCPTAQEAKEVALSLIQEHASVAWGGSMTLGQIGLIDALHARQSAYTLLDRDKAGSPAERTSLMKQALTADVYLTSVNAITQNGILVNVDSMGNRVAALTYGPEKVIAVVSMNKVVKTVEDAISRARNFSAPINVQRLGLSQPPCLKTGLCADCQTDECICSTIVQTRMCKVKDRIQVILVGEPLGY